MVLALIGGILMMIGPFISFLAGCLWGQCQGFGIADPYLPGELLYAYLILVFGILVLIFGILTPVLRKKQYATMTWVFALVGMVIGIVVLIHAIVRAESYIGYSGVSVVPSVGFFLVVAGAVLGMVGGFLLSSVFARLPPAPMQAPVQPGQPQYGQPQAQYPPQQYQPQQPPPPQQPPAY
jgi:hypothetical protein